MLDEDTVFTLDGYATQAHHIARNSLGEEDCSDGGESVVMIMSDPSLLRFVLLVIADA